MDDSLDPSQTHAPARAYRVLMIAPTSFFADYGGHVRILEEVRALQRLGHRITIVTYHNGEDAPGLDVRRTLPIPWRQDYEVGSSRHKIAFDALLGWKTLEVLARERFDVIHAHMHEGALIGLILGRIFGLPVVFDFQGSMTEEMIDHHFLTRGSRVHRPLRRLERWIDRSASVVFTSSANAERLLLEEFDCEPARIRTLPDCVDSSVFRPASDFDPTELAALRERLSLPEEAKVIVYLGLLAEYQGTSLLLEATQRIVARHPDVYLLLMGFPGVAYYAQKAVDLGIADHVRLTGRVPYPQAPIHLALGDVAVGPKLSLSEGMGKLLNYMAAALPTVAFDTPVAREYLGYHGLFARRGDVESLAAMIETGLFDQEAMADVGQRLRQRAIRKFEWSGAAQTIVDAYAQARGELVIESASAESQAVEQG